MYICNNIDSIISQKDLFSVITRIRIYFSNPLINPSPLLIIYGKNFDPPYNFFIPPIIWLSKIDDERKVKSKAKGDEGEDSLVCLCLHRLLTSRVLRMRKKNKKPRGSILYQIKISLNGISRVETFSLKNISERKAFTT